MQKVIYLLSICSFMGVFHMWNYLNSTHSKTKCKQNHVVAYAYLPVNYKAWLYIVQCILVAITSTLHKEHFWLLETPHFFEMLWRQPLKLQCKFQWKARHLDTHHPHWCWVFNTPVSLWSDFWSYILIIALLRSYLKIVLKIFALGVTLFTRNLFFS